jgi:uncharacterized protein (TIGR02145 family)
LKIDYKLAGKCGEDLTVADIDGNIYPVVRIGEQYWMARNLSVTQYRNGDPIPADLDAEQWDNTSSGATTINDYWYYHDINSIDDVVEMFGRHYNWHAVVDQRGLCPQGWKVPSDADWTQLSDYVIDNYENIDENNISYALRSTSRWGYFDWDEHNGTDDFGFNALPAGYIEYPHMFSWGMAFLADWWCACEYDETLAWFRSIEYNKGQLIRSRNYKQAGASVRCLKE